MVAQRPAGRHRLALPAVRRHGRGRARRTAASIARVLRRGSRRWSAARGSATNGSPSAWRARSAIGPRLDDREVVEVVAVEGHVDPAPGRVAADRLERQALRRPRAGAGRAAASRATIALGRHRRPRRPPALVEPVEVAAVVVVVRRPSAGRERGRRRSRSRAPASRRDGRRARRATSRGRRRPTAPRPGGARRRRRGRPTSPRGGPTARPRRPRGRGRGARRSSVAQVGQRRAPEVESSRLPRPSTAPSSRSSTRSAGPRRRSSSASPRAGRRARRSAGTPPRPLRDSTVRRRPLSSSWSAAADVPPGEVTMLRSSAGCIPDCLAKSVEPSSVSITRSWAMWRGKPRWTAASMSASMTRKT